MRVEPAIGPAAPSRRFTSFRYNNKCGRTWARKLSGYHHRMLFPSGEFMTIVRVGKAAEDVEKLHLDI
jgi:hypothetical protein